MYLYLVQRAQSHYQRLGSCSVDDAFDDNWKQEVDSKVNEYHRCSVEHDDPVLDREIELQEITRLVVVVGELFKYGRSGMLHLLHKLFEVVWREELVPPKWREGLIVNLF